MADQLTVDLSAAAPQSQRGEDQRWRLSRNLVHEMRSVLTAVRIAGEVLGSERAEDQNFRRNYAGMIAEQSGRVGRLLEDFSELLRPESTTAPGQSEECADLNVALDQARRDLEGFAAQLGVSAELVPAGFPALVPGDQGQVTQALRGLLEHLLTTVARGSTVVAEVRVPSYESEVAAVVYSQRQPEAEQATAQPLDWERISLRAARRIVERHGGSILDEANAEQEPVVVYLPRHRGAGQGILRPQAWTVADPCVYELSRRAA